MENYTDTKTRPQMEKIAKAEGCKAVFATETILQMDLDGPDGIKRFTRLYEIALDQGFLTDSVISGLWRSKSGQGWHVEVRLAELMCHEDRIFWQALLGSDEVREILNLKKQKEYVCLFRPTRPIK